MLRTRLLAALNDEEEGLAVVLKCVEVLTKAVAVEYRISPRVRKDLADNMAAVLNRFGDLILPADR